MKVGAGLALVLFLAGCGAAPAVDTTAPSGPVITVLTTEYAETWDVAWAPADDVRADYETVLATNGIWSLIPTVANGAESLSADVDVTRTMPTNRWATGITVRRPDRSVFVSLQTAPSVSQPTCASRLDGSSGTDWSPMQVRGIAGCALLVDGAVSFIEWTEDGQFFHAEFGPELEADELGSWLDTWAPLARPRPDGA